MQSYFNKLWPTELLFLDIIIWYSTRQSVLGSFFISLFFFIPQVNKTMPRHCTYIKQVL